MKSIFYSAIISFALLSLFSCKEHEDIVNSKDSKKDTNQSTFALSDGSTTLSDVIENYLYEPNLVGVIEFNSLEQHDLTWTETGGVKTYHENDFTTNYAYAGFRYNDDPFTVENLLINASLLREYADGAYSKTGPDELDLYFNGSTPNKYYIECLDNSYIPDTVKSQVIFSNGIQITNVQRYDTLSRSSEQGFQVNWVGGAPSGKIAIHIGLNDYFEANENESSGMYELSENDGTHTFQTSQMEMLGPVNTYYDVEVECYEPIFHTLDNGNKICLVGVSRYRTTVYLKE